MREIKFRAWDKLNYRFLSMPLVGIDFENDCVNSYEIEQIADTEYKMVQNVCYSYELMQYTGLKDKNGVEIYEGDICRCLGGSEFNGYYEYNRIYEVKWQGSGLEMMIDDCGYGWNYSIGFEYIEVIGNIYENQELLN